MSVGDEIIRNEPFLSPAAASSSSSSSSSSAAAAASANGTGLLQTPLAPPSSTPQTPIDVSLSPWDNGVWGAGRGRLSGNVGGVAYPSSPDAALLSSSLPSSSPGKAVLFSGGEGGALDYFTPFVAAVEVREDAAEAETLAGKMLEESNGGVRLPMLMQEALRLQLLARLWRGATPRERSP